MKNVITMAEIEAHLLKHTEILNLQTELVNKHSELFHQFDNALATVITSLYGTQQRLKAVENLLLSIHNDAKAFLEGQAEPEPPPSYGQYL